jgi:hypothetical protein
MLSSPSWLRLVRSSRTRPRGHKDEPADIFFSLGSGLMPIDTRIRSPLCEHHRVNR